MKKQVSFFQKANEVSDLLNSDISISAQQNIILSDIQSNFTDQEYLNAVDQVKDRITEGEFCEANLTRKFFGKVQNEKNAFSCYKDIVGVNKVAYGAYLSFADVKIVSFSPERFLRINKRHAYARPIKGTMPASSDKYKNQKIAHLLKNCAKNKAENLMIVDLMRNDFAKICEAGSVRVPKLFETDIYRNVIHMYSIVTGKIKEENTALDLIESAFPPGSMTGAPKIEVIKTCNNIEGYARGLYSGAIGYYHPIESDFSVVIRTLILQNDKFEFQVGGAIVADSVPELELEEIYAKAKPFLKYLKVKC